MDIFEQGSRIGSGFRFETNRGDLAVEDLWQLPLKSKHKRPGEVSLNIIAQGLNRKIRENDEVDFVDEKSSANEILELKMKIVKHIIAVKKAEIKKAEDFAATISHNKKITNLIAKKKDADLENLTVEELEKLKK